MASNTQDAGGYDRQWVKDPPDSLKCVICLLVVREPQQHGDCGRVFCNSCITEYKKKKDTCPCCRGALATFNDGKSSREVRSLEVKCDNEDCTWQGELRSLSGHIGSCEFTLVDCPNECDVEKLARKDLKVHLESECLKRDYTCPHCEEEGEYDEMTTTHLEECPDIEIECPNEGCGERFPRFQLEEHECDYQIMACKYAKFGCTMRLLRKDLKNHEEDDQLHLQMTMNKVFDLVSDVASLQNELQAKNEQITSLEMKIRSDSFFVFKIHDWEEVHSPPFYTFRGGYKMYVKVSKKGVFEDQPHLSVYAYLMKGDNDDYLTWPFIGTVTIELLNQLEDKNHRKKSLTFPANSGKRVLVGEKGSGRGKTRFIFCADLGYQRDKNCQYLKDDTLVFRVFVEVPDHKPWLY